MKQCILLLLCLWLLPAFTQINCNIFLTSGDSCRYAACTFLESAPQYFQLTREFHAVYDEALAICPAYSDAYRAKSVAYLKTGDFISWKQLMDQAVALNPIEHLSYRGWCRFQFFRDYQGAIADIERLERLMQGDIGYSQNGTYHMQVTKALCYSSLGQADTAISLLSLHLETYEDPPGLFDYLHLGVMQLRQGQYPEALATFGQQEGVYACAELAYYQALVFKQRGDLSQARSFLDKARERYLARRSMHDPYTHQLDKIYLADIEWEIEHTD